MMLSVLVIVVSLLASATAFRAPKSPVAAGIQLRMSFEDAVGAQPPLGKCATLSGIIRQNNSSRIMLMKYFCRFLGSPWLAEDCRPSKI